MANGIIKFILFNKLMKLIFSHPTGNANARAAAYGFAEADLLSQFYTTLASFSGSMLDRLGVINALSDIRRRRFDASLRPYICMSPWREIGRLAASKMGFTQLTAHEKGPFCIDAVYRSIDRRIAANLSRGAGRRINAVYAYEDGAAYSFREAKRLGIQCLYDLPIGYWRTAHRLLETEKARWPEWVSTLTGFSDSESKLLRKDEELRLSDRIFVASSFTAHTLKDFPGVLAPIEIIPYGFPPVVAKREYDTEFHNKPLQLLFVGALSQRKGIADLFAAVNTLGTHVELTIVGNKVSNNCKALDDSLAKHRWLPSLPNPEVIKLMKKADVLVFPSLFEGFGLVITEAMSQGTPVITTERTAGSHFIKHGVNGWLVEAGSTAALQAAIEKLVRQPEAISEAGIQAMHTAGARPWEVYRRELVNAVQRHFEAIT